MKNVEALAHMALSHQCEYSHVHTGGHMVYMHVYMLHIYTHTYAYSE